MIENNYFVVRIGYPGHVVLLEPLDGLLLVLRLCVAEVFQPMVIESFAERILFYG